MLYLRLGVRVLLQQRCRGLHLQVLQVGALVAQLGPQADARAGSMLGLPLRGRLAEKQQVHKVLQQAPVKEGRVQVGSTGSPTGSAPEGQVRRRKGMSLRRWRRRKEKGVRS
jgi:hypothetical protein